MHGPRLRRCMRSRVLALLLGIAVPIALWAALPLVSSGAPSTGKIQSKIDSKRGQIERKKRVEGMLTTTISGYTRRINALQSNITALQRRQDAIQSNLDGERALLARIQQSLLETRARLVRLRARLVQSRAVLADRLRAVYEA